jgi:hypothetical protein
MSFFEEKKYNDNYDIESEEEYIQRTTNIILSFQEYDIKLLIEELRNDAIKKRLHLSLYQYAIINNFCNNLVRRTAKEKVEEELKKHYPEIKNKQLKITEDDDNIIVSL